MRLAVVARQIAPLANLIYIFKGQPYTSRWKRMQFREVTDADCGRVVSGVLAMSHAETLEETTMALVHAAMDLVACDHGGFSEVDTHFNRTRLFSSEREIGDWVERRAAVWHHYMPSHPVLRYRTENPGVAVVRLSDVANLSSFYSSGLYNELFREVETDHQLVMHLGTDPRDQHKSGALPLTLGVPLNRKRHDFTRRDKEILSLLQHLAKPVLRQKRARHHYALLQAAVLSPELLRALVGLGLTERQAEVAFWMLKGKSNTDIGVILEIGAQTVRQHSIAIYRRFGIQGRLALQRTILMSILDVE